MRLPGFVRVLRRGALGAAALGLCGLAGVSSARAADAAPVFVPPPRSIADITAILDQEKPDPAKVAERKRIADAAPPSALGDVALAKFYMDRGAAAGLLGRFPQLVADLHQAVDLAKPHPGAHLVYIDALSRLRAELNRAGDMEGSTAAAREVIQQTEDQGRPNMWTAGAYQTLITNLAQSGDLPGARDAQQKLQRLADMFGQQPPFTSNRAGLAWTIDRTQGKLASYEGRLADADTALRRAIAEADEQSRTFVATNEYQAQNWEAAASYTRSDLATTLFGESRLVEAEIVSRQALLNELKLRGRYAIETIDMVKSLAGVLAAEGRFKESEQLDRIALDTYASMGVDQSSRNLNNARSVLASALVGEARWADALQQFDLIQKGLASDPGFAKNQLEGNMAFLIATIRGGRAAQAVDVARRAMESAQTRFGPNDFRTALQTGLYADALAASGNIAAAREAYAKAAPVLFAGAASDAGNDALGTGRFDRWRSTVLGGYLNLLAKDSGPTAAAEAFRVADAGRSQTVQRAVAAAAARAAARDPALADLVRREQDAQRQVDALSALLANGYAMPSGERDDAALEKLRTQIDQLTADRKAMRAEIERKFPDYVRLANPMPATIAEAHAALQPGEAMIVVYMAVDQTYLWAVPQAGDPAFAVSPLSRAQAGGLVKALRKSLDPDASTAGQIPAFDVASAYKLYAGLLEPVKAGWGNAKTLLVVASGALGQLPFGLLVTQSVKLAADQAGQPLFSAYKDVPWLIRQVAVTQLPSVTSLTTLRATPAATGQRKPFIGFGDPYFSKKEEAQAIAEQGTLLALQIAGGGGAIVDMRKAPVKLRSAPKTETVNSAELADLPRLPDTAEEVREVAAALKADAGKDVYLGTQANEQIVRTLKLDDRRVIMFATHGLVPGDLDGLTEPALALTAPDVAKVSGDGLLTVSKILGLRLNADWVVLSACNTASGNGAGAEAVSGLGLAFFYAGSRALLVSNWPVETISARLLTTELFKREAATPGLARAEALRQAMLALIDGPGMIDQFTRKPVYSYAHPIFWAPFSLVGDGGAS
jgi:CHAT domain-containing protein